MGTRIIAGLAIVLTALALIPSAAHLASLPNKIDLSEEDYFLAQSLYRGWWLFSGVIIAALATNVWLAILLTAGNRLSSSLAAAAAALIIASLAVFLAEIYPINRETGNWTMIPDDWEAMRAHWEYAHAVEAGIIFVALCCVTAAVLFEDGINKG
ncbi:MAG TPA: DUF1772 domain-containing protein [Methylocella sp.]|nr:DUF1772 domain-containing protein [Methylocella sp.]